MSSNDPFHLPPNVYGKSRHVVEGRIVISAVIFLLLLVWYVFLLQAYAKWFRRHGARFPRRRSASRRRRFQFTGQEPATLRNVGLESAVIETLRVFQYKPQNFIDGLECAVCLCEFEENEKGRLLPNCGHSFHVECIDMWFLSHSTCPLCRIAAQPEQPVLDPARFQHISVTIAEPIHGNLNSEQTHSSANCGDCRTQQIGKPDADE